MTYEPRDYKGEYQEAEERAAIAKDLADNKVALAAWDQKRLQLESQLGAAKEDGDAAAAWRLTQQLDEHQKSRPHLSELTTMGRTPQELMQSVPETIGMLPPELGDALVAHYESQAQSTESAVETMAAVYGDLAPKERIQVMENDARRIMSAPKVPTVDLQFNPEGFGKGVGDDARADNPAIPAGGMKDMPPSANLGDTPVTKRGTQLIQNPDGSSSMRAFSPDQMAPYMQLDPYPSRITPEWTEQMKAVGAAMGLDYRKFANEGMFVSEAAKRLAEQQRLMGGGPKNLPPKYETQALPTGGYRMRPTEATTAKNDLAKLRARIKNTGEKRGLPEGVQKELMEVLDGAETGPLSAEAIAEAEKKAGTIMREYNTQNAMDRGRSYRDSVAKEVWTRQATNPRMALGMLKASLDEAGTDPAKQALVYRQFGMPGEGARIDSIEAQRQIAEASAANERARINAATKDKGVLPADANAAGTRSAIQQAFDPTVGPEMAMASFAATQNQLRGTKSQPDDYVEEFAAVLLQYSPDAAFNTSVVQRALRKIKDEQWGRDARNFVTGGYVDDRREAFMKAVRDRLGAQAEKKAAEWWELNKDQ